MKSVPKPKPRPHNPEHDCTVRVGELPLVMGLGSHLVITGHDPEGTQLRKFNGLATGPDNKPKAVGLPWDSSDTIKVHFEAGPKGPHGHKLRNQRAVRWGSLDNINEFRRVAHATDGLVNDIRTDCSNPDCSDLNAGHQI